MHSEPAIENRAADPAVRGRRRKRGNGAAALAEGPVFVDNSGRRSKLLRRAGLLVGVLCAGYTVVLGLAFMGIGTSLSPSSLLPFGGGNGSAPGGGMQPQGGIAPTGAPPTGAPNTGAPQPGAPGGAVPGSVPTPAASASAD